MPAELVARARELADGGSWTPPEAVPAATVVLLRDGAAGLEVLLMRRPDTMAFAPGMHVFPGGRVDLVHDSRPVVTGWLPTGDWGDATLSRALAVAAVRETFEEAGVLLAVDRTGRTPHPDGTWSADRLACEAAGAFPSLLQRRHLHVACDLLVPIAHWITPEVESRRFDTRFVAAALPVDQEVTAHATETDSAHWLSPHEALAANARGGRAMLPPTVAVLRMLALARDVADALDRARRSPIRPIMPRARVEGDEVRWALVHGYTGEVLAQVPAPAGSEERGNRG